MIRLFKRSLLLAFALASLALAGCNGARSTAVDLLGKHERTGFMMKELTRGARTRKYVVFVPLDYNFTNPAKTPVIIFLHGANEGGNLSKAQIRVGLGPIVADLESSFHFIVIFPQSDTGYWDPDGQNTMDVMAELDAVAKMYPGADLDRVSLTGIGSGGYGTWVIGAKYRNRFAALVPMASTASDSGAASSLVNMPIRAYHNSGDMIARPFNDTIMVDRIRALGGKAEMFKTEGFSTNCWEEAYGETDLFQWLAQQSRNRGFSAAPTRGPASSGPSLRANSAAYVSAAPYHP
jgi:predicted peptidase